MNRAESIGVAASRFARRSGYVLIIGVILLGAVALTIAVSLLLTGIGNVRSQLVLTHAIGARALAEACIEEAIIRIKHDVNDRETGNIDVGERSCAIESIEELEPYTYRIRASGSYEEAFARIEAVITAEVGQDDVVLALFLLDWRQVGDFEL
jgi:hypothetical protein